MTIEDFRQLFKSVFSAFKIAFKKSTWESVINTKQNNDFTWWQSIGIFFLGEYRLYKHFQRGDSY